MLSRSTDTELAGSVSVKLVPALAMVLVTGKTYAGDARELASPELPDASWTTVALVAIAFTPLTLNVVASGVP